MSLKSGTLCWLSRRWFAQSASWRSAAHRWHKTTIRWDCLPALPLRQSRCSRQPLGSRPGPTIAPIPNDDSRFVFKT